IVSVASFSIALGAAAGLDAYTAKHPSATQPMWIVPAPAQPESRYASSSPLTPRRRSPRRARAERSAWPVPPRGPQRAVSALGWPRGRRRSHPSEGGGDGGRRWRDGGDGDGGGCIRAKTGVGPIQRDTFHGEGNDHRRHECASGDQPLEKGPLRG